MDQDDRILQHEGGMAPNFVQKFLDHVNISTTSRYLKVDPGDARRS
jgi:site-specific recombinase XerD